MTKSSLLLLLVGACGVGDDGGSTVKMDAAVDMAMANKVAAVTCPASPAATVMTVNGTDAYMPMNTPVSVGAIVRFVMSSEHDVQPNPIGTTDPGMDVDFGQTKCLQFNAAGTYGFFCTGHSFAGTITVQ